MAKNNNNPAVRSKKPQNKTILHQEIKAFGFSGPIPPPDVLQYYENISPGFANRIIAMAEAEMVHRQSMEKRSIEADISINNRILKDNALEIRLGQIFAFIITLFMTLAGGYIIIAGYPGAGSFISVAGIGGIVTTFILGRGKRGSTSNQNGSKDKEH